MLSRALNGQVLYTLVQRAMKVGCFRWEGEPWGGGNSQASRSVLWKTRGTVPQHPNQESRAALVTATRGSTKQQSPH